VLERGLAAIPLSVDLWMHYINFVKERYKDHEEEEFKIRQYVVHLIDFNINNVSSLFNLLFQALHYIFI